MYETYSIMFYNDIAFTNAAHSYIKKNIFKLMERKQEREIQL